MEKQKVTVQDIADGIVKMIKDGEFVQGAPLREVEVCQRFGVSRTPVREAFRLLQNYGVVNYIPRCGVQVMEMNLEDHEAVTDLRTVIEVLSTKKAAKYATEEDIRKLREINLKFSQAESAEEQGYLDRELHMYIAKISRNPLIGKYLTELYIRQTWTNIVIPFRQERIPYSYREHESIIQAIEWHDEELAEQQAAVHFNISQRTQKQKLQQYIKEQEMDKDRKCGMEKRRRREKDRL